MPSILTNTWVYTRQISPTRQRNGTTLELNGERKPEHSINLIKIKNKSIKLAKTINDARTLTEHAILKM